MELNRLRSMDSFRRDLKIFLFDSVYGHQDTNDSVMRPWSSSRMHNTSASVTITAGLFVSRNIFKNYTHILRKFLALAQNNSQDFGDDLVPKNFTIFLY